MVGQLLKILGLDFLLDKEGKMAPGPRMKREGSKASRDKGWRVGGNGRRWAEAGKWDLVSARGAKCLPPPNMATISAAIALSSCLGNHRAVKESGPWAGEEAGGLVLGGGKLWLPQLDSGWWVM